MALTISQAATFLGVPLSSPHGSERVSGHSLRATGAQGLAAAGVDTWAIELLGRWGSDAVRGYVREARLADAAAMARRVADAAPLDVVVARILAGHSGAPPAAQASTATASLAIARGAAASSEEGGPPAPVLVDVSAPLAAEVDLARAVLASPTRDDFVLNTVTGAAHRVVIGFDDAPPATWTAACGWRFGMALWRTPPARIGAAELPRVPQLLCARCLPSQRRAALAALSDATDVDA